MIALKLSLYSLAISLSLSGIVILVYCYSCNLSGLCGGVLKYIYTIYIIVVRELGMRKEILLL